MVLDGSGQPWAFSTNVGANTFRSAGGLANHAERLNVTLAIVGFTTAVPLAVDAGWPLANTAAPDVLRGPPAPALPDPELPGCAVQVGISMVTGPVAAF